MFLSRSMFESGTARLALYYTIACRTPDIYVSWEDLHFRVFSRECTVVIEGYHSFFKGPSFHCPLPEECK